MLHWADWTVIALYLVAILGIALFFFLRTYFKKQDNSSNFFTGGGKNPVIIVALSMWATITSSIFFVNAAGQVAGNAWLWSGANIALIGITPIIAIFVIPFYRRIKETTAYAFLEKRFNYSIRAVNSISFILFQIFRVAVVLFVPVTVLTLVVDIDPYVLLVLVGVVVVITTVIGGFKAVIWSDALQGLVLLVGILAIIITGIYITPWGKGLGDQAFKYHQLLTRDSWKIGLGQTGISFIFVYSIINSLYAFMGSQDVTQRYKGTKSLAQVRKTLYITSIMGIITLLLFFGAGSILWTYYANTVPDFAKGNIANFDKLVIKAATETVGDKPILVTEATFMPYFMSKQLPVGLVGLLFAAIFAASQSTVSSGLSALANSISVDFIQKFWPKMKDKKLTWISKGIVLLFGTLSIGAGAVLIYTKETSLFNYFTGVVGLLNAPTVAVFLLGIFSIKTNWKGVLIGMVIAICIGAPLWVMSQKFIPKDIAIKFHGGWLTMLTFSVTLVLSYVFSLVFSSEEMDPKTGKLSTKAMESRINRTMWTRTPELIQLSKIDENIDKVEKWTKKGLISQNQLDRLRKKYDELDEIVKSQSN